MNEIKPGCFKGDTEVCEREKCGLAEDCMWRRRMEDGGRGPLMVDIDIGSEIMEGGVPILRR